MSRRNTVWSWFWMVLGGLYFFLPLLATFEFSLKAKKGVYSFLAYERVFADPLFLRTFIFSLEMAVFTALAGILLIFPTVYWIRLKLPQLRGLIEFVSMLPFVVPAIVLVFGLIRVFSGAPFFLTNTFLGTNVLLVAAYVVLTMPYLYRSIDTGLQAIDVRTLTEAAQSLGAGWATILFRVILPNVRVSILSGSFLAVATVMGEFTIASFLVGIRAFGPYMSLVGQNKTYESSSLAIISFALTWAFIGLIQFLNRGRAQTQIAGAH